MREQSVGIFLLFGTKLLQLRRLETLNELFQQQKKKGWGAVLLYRLVICQDVMVNKTFKGLVCKTCKDACIKDLLSEFHQRSVHWRVLLSLSDPNAASEALTAVN